MQLSIAGLSRRRAEFRRNAILPCMLLESFDCRSSSNRPKTTKIQNHMCWMAGKMESRNHQSSDWQTNRLIPRPDHILLHWVFVRLRIRIEDRFLLCIFLYDPFFCLYFGESPWVHLCPIGKGENHSYGSHHCLLTSPSCFSFLWTTKLGLLLAAIRDLALAHHQRMLFRSFWMVPCRFLFPFLFFFSSGGP